MKDKLRELYGLNVEAVLALSRKDSGNGNDIFKLSDNSHEYFLKEISDQSIRDDLEKVYSELSKCHLSKAKMVLPIKSLKGSYVVQINDKKFMLYYFLEHKVFHEVHIEIEKLFEVLKEFFLVFKQVEILEHPFKDYSNWFLRGSSELKKKVEHHKFLDLFDQFIDTRFNHLEFSVGNTHFDLNPFNILVDNSGEICLADFDNAQSAAYAKDIFDVCSKYLVISADEVSISNQNLEKIFRFSQDYVNNLEINDVRFLLVRPKLGSLFDSSASLSHDDLLTKMNLLYDFCRST